MARRCYACGLWTDRAICQRCDTILRPDRAFCPRCRAAFDSWIAACTECGTTIEGPPAAADPEAVRALAAVPGITESRAKDLVAHGFHDFADIVRLALPEGAVRLGLHHAIARKVMLADLERPSGTEATDARCSMCDAAWIAGSARCAVCGSAGDPSLDPTVIERNLDELKGEIVDLAADEDFRNMPEDIRRDLLHASGGIAEEDLDAGPLEQFFEDDSVRFPEADALTVHAPAAKGAEDKRHRCPLCDVRLQRAVEECENCGARLG